MFDIILLTLAVLYAAGILTLALAAALSRYPANRAYRPAVSIIIAARDEEEAIPACLASLLALTYPRERLDIIIVDDHSTDATARIVNSCAQENPQIRLLSAGPPSGHLVGKASAVAQAFDIARGDIVLLSDADCRVPPGWIEETVKYYVDKEVGIVPGFTFIRYGSSFDAIQSLDWFTLFSVAAASTRLGFPVTAVGTNLSLRKAAYDLVGGYRKIPFSVTEDYALFHAVTSSTPYRARFPIDPRTIVESEPCPDWKTLFRQRKRWFTGGKGMDAKSLVLFAPAWLLNLGILAGFLTGWFTVAVAALAIKAGVDLVLTLPALATFRRWKLLAYFPLFEVYFFFYVLVFPPIVLLHRDVHWKDRTIPG